MAKPALVIILSLLSFLPGHAQSPAGSSDAHLVWNEFYTLQWDDFRGKPDPDAMGDAGTAVHIKAKPFIVNKEVHYDVRAIFNRDKSWARDTSPSLLAHERLHFDIAELYARKIRKKVSELRKRGVRDIGAFNSAIEKLLEESNTTDARYDLETLHGALPKKQSIWVKKVKDELADLNDYQKTKWIIGG